MYSGAKITTNTWVSGALELDIDVSFQCYTYLLLFNLIQFFISLYVEDIEMTYIYTAIINDQ